MPNLEVLLARRHSSCCNIRRGCNPVQSQYVETFLMADGSLNDVHYRLSILRALKLMPRQAQHPPTPHLRLTNAFATVSLSPFMQSRRRCSPLFVLSASPTTQFTPNLLAIMGPRYMRNLHEFKFLSPYSGTTSQIESIASWW